MKIEATGISDGCHCFCFRSIGGFSTESGLFLLYVKNRLERGFAPADS